MEVCNREQIEADFLADEECYISILETLLQLRGMNMSGIGLSYEILFVYVSIARNGKFRN